MTAFETPTHSESELLKKYPQSSFIEGAYKDIQKATRNELESLKKKYEWAIKEHEQSVSENRTTMFSDLLREVEARRKTLPVVETRTVKVQRLKKAIEGQKGWATSVDVWKLLQDHREKSKDVLIPVNIDLSPDIKNDPFWKNLEAFMFRNTFREGAYYLCVKEKNQSKWLCFVEFSQEEYLRRISKEVPVKDRVGKTYGIGDEIRIGI